MSESSPQLSYVARVVRDFDRERFVTALFAPSERREALLTLYAFNSEIARVRESVREPMAGMIRLQWWRDVLGHGAAGGARHPIAEPLCRLIAEHGLALASFERVLEGREADLDSAAPADLDSAVAYADATGGEVAVLAARLLGGTGMDEAARHVGIAWALVGQCRALAFHLSIGRLTLPEAVLVAAGITSAATTSSGSDGSPSYHGPLGSNPSGVGVTANSEDLAVAATSGSASAASGTPGGGASGANSASPSGSEAPGAGAGAAAGSSASGSSSSGAPDGSAAGTSGAASQAGSGVSSASGAVTSPVGSGSGTGGSGGASGGAAGAGAPGSGAASPSGG